MEINSAQSAVIEVVFRALFKSSGAGPSQQKRVQLKSLGNQDKSKSGLRLGKCQIM